MKWITPFFAEGGARKNIFKLAFLAAVILNCDKILLWHFSLIRIHDTFDGNFPFYTSLINNILKHGFVAQSQSVVCGISNAAFPTALPYLLTGLIIPPYANYLFHSLFITFAAFSGMFLLLHDEFKIGSKSSVIGALFFSSLPGVLVIHISIAGLPLLIWALERLFNGRHDFKDKLIFYAYAMIYFLCSTFTLLAPVLIPFYIFYFLFLSRIRKNAKNILILCLLWSLYLFINLPLLSELVPAIKTSLRSDWCLDTYSLWKPAIFSFMRSIFSIDIYGFVTVPPILAILLIFKYLFSSKASERNNRFSLIAVFTIVVMIFTFVIIKLPLWKTIMNTLTVFKTFNFDRLAWLLSILYSILIAFSCDFILKKNKIINLRSWIIPLIPIFLYVAGLIYIRPCYITYTTNQFFIQIFTLISFFVLVILRSLFKDRVKTFLVLFVPFVFLAGGITLASKFHSMEIQNHYRLFNSGQIDRVKAIEKGNLDDFRVAKVDGYYPGQLLHNGFKCVDAYVSLYPQSYKEVWSKIIEPDINRRDRPEAHSFIYDGTKVYLFDSSKKRSGIKELSFKNDILKLMNVKYLFSDFRVLNPGRYGMDEIAQRSPIYLGLPKWKKYFSKWEYYVYENREFAPPVFLTDYIDIFDNKEEVLDALGSQKYGYLRRHTLAAKKDLENISATGLSINNSEIIEYKLTPDRIDVTMRNEYPVLINWTRNYNKNWACKIDGTETKIFRIYNSFMGVVVPAGSQKVSFRYRNIYFQYACMISLLGIIIINVLIIRHFKSCAVDRPAMTHSK